MNLETPTSWRKGQTIFNFLCWLKVAKGYQTEVAKRDHLGKPVQGDTQMADPFYIPDEIWDELYAEYLARYQPKQ